MALPLKKRAIISVYDKTGAIEFAKELITLGYDILSTDGTANVLKKAGLNIMNISDITGFPECLDGRVKTLHPMVHAGILAVRGNVEHLKQLRELNVVPIDIVAINLYPFKQTILKNGVTRENAIENIDVGGPAMLRAAAKNWQDVAVIVDPNDYKNVISEIKALNTVTKTTKLKFAYKVFEHTSSYDTLIADYLRKETDSEILPDNLTFTYDKAYNLPHGENPHQRAAFYNELGNNYTGKLLYNEICNIDIALKVLNEFHEPCVVSAVNSNINCVAAACDIHKAYKNMKDISGVIVLNRTVDESLAAEIIKSETEIIIAPDFTSEAKELLSKMCMISLPEKSPETLDLKKVSGGLLVQEQDNELLYESELRFVTELKPTDEQMNDLIFAMKIVKHIKTCGIVLAKNNVTVGIGSGQTTYQRSYELAKLYAGDDFTDSVMAADCNIPMNNYAIKALIMPGDSCAEYGNNDFAVVLTNISHQKY